jgi:hypothetical protein
VVPTATGVGNVKPALAATVKVWLSVVLPPDGVSWRDTLSPDR